MAENPKFANPPVVETVLGVQFPEIEGFRATHFGLYWQTIKDRYPRTDDQPRLDSVRERFPRLPLPLPHIQFRQQTQPDRVWFTGKKEDELIQVQPDRFHYNWRRRKDEYPSYETNCKQFFEQFEKFCSFCEQHELPKPSPELCEVTYVNHIDPESGETALELAGRLFAGLGWVTVDQFLPIPESFTFNRSYVISDQEVPTGRLYAEASIAVRRPRTEANELKDFILFKLTARTNHDDEGKRALTESLQLAHDWVVRGFADLTDREIQEKRWERQQ